MNELNLNWEEFVERFKAEEIKPLVDINKGHALMKSEFAPSNWRTMIKVLTPLCLFAIPVSLVLFFFVKWWIPCLIILLALMTIKAIRGESAKAVIETSLENPAFYSHAVLSGTLKLVLNKPNA